MKKALWAILFLSAGIYIATLAHPLNSIFDFIIGGTIPGTTISLGFWPFMGMVLTAVGMLMRALKGIRLQLLEQTAKQIKADKQKVVHDRLSEEITFDRTKRAVIAAPSLESTSL